MKNVSYHKPTEAQRLLEKAAADGHMKLEFTSAREARRMAIRLHNQLRWNRQNEAYGGLYDQVEVFQEKNMIEIWDYGDPKVERPYKIVEVGDE